MRNVGMLESIVNKVLTPVRISPTGAIVCVGGAAMLIGGITAQLSDIFLVRLSGAVGVGIGLPTALYGTILYAMGVGFYKQATRLMRHEAAKQHAQKIIESNLYYYCTRNAYHAAAKVTGLGQDFELINAAYNGPRENRWLPGV